jgi:PIN domain nuclease of toxin-antitoxin system
MAAVLDTHAVIWYLFRSKDLSAAALQAIREAIGAGSAVYIYAISLIEISYLSEKGRIPADALQRLTVALSDPASGLRIAPVDTLVAEAIQKVSRDIVPDMPDRIIAATAISLSLPLVTRDQRIQSAKIKTIW